MIDYRKLYEETLAELTALQSEHAFKVDTLRQALGKLLEHIPSLQAGPAMVEAILQAAEALEDTK